MPILEGRGVTARSGVVVEPVVEMLLDHLRPWERNPRKISAHRQRDLMETMSAEQDLLRVRPVVALPDGTVFAGVQRYLAAELLGWETVPVIVVHGLSEAQMRIWALLDNQPFAQWDEPQLVELLSDLLADGVDAALTGFETRELDRILASVTPAGDLEAIPEPSPMPNSQPGSEYVLGRHRLLCGDSTDAASLARVLRSERVAVLVTDLPWGVDYVGKTAERLTIPNDDPAALPEFLTAAFTALDAVLGPSVPFYLFAPTGPAGTEFLLALRNVGWRHRQTLVWCKDSIVLGHADYHQRHEAILYGFTRGSGRVGRGTGNGWFGGNDQASVLFCDRPKRSPEHPTAKPVELLARLIRNSTRRGELVLDPFCGSGATVLACEVTGRRCAAVELEPRYADLIRARYQEFISG